MADQAKKTVGQYVDWIGKYVEAALEDINNLRQQQAAGEEGLGATACDRQCRVFACAPALCKCVRRLSPGPVMGGLIPVVQCFCCLQYTVFPSFVGPRACVPGVQLHTAQAAHVLLMALTE